MPLAEAFVPVMEGAEAVSARIAALGEADRQRAEAQREWVQRVVAAPPKPDFREPSRAEVAAAHRAWTIVQSAQADPAQAGAQVNGSGRVA